MRGDPSPFCIEDQRELRCEKNGVLVLLRDGNGEAYRIWSADLYQCPTCGGRQLHGYSPPIERSYGEAETAWRHMLAAWTTIEDEWRFEYR